MHTKAIFNMSREEHRSYQESSPAPSIPFLIPLDRVLLA